MTQPPQEPYGQQPGAGPPQGGGGGPAYGEGLQGGMPPYPGGAGGYTAPATGLASRWARLGAAIIDGVLVYAIASAVTVPFVGFGDWSSDGGTFRISRFSSNLVGALLAFVYFWLMQANRGQTLGKMALGIRVVRAEDGGAITNNQALGRSAFQHLLTSPLVLFCVGPLIGLLDVLWILWDDRKQCLHDKAAKTLVMKAGAGVPDPYANR